MRHDWEDHDETAAGVRRPLDVRVRIIASLAGDDDTDRLFCVAEVAPIFRIQTNKLTFSEVTNDSSCYKRYCRGEEDCVWPEWVDGDWSSDGGEVRN